MTYRQTNIAADQNSTQAVLRNLALLIVAVLIISGCASNGGSGSQSSFSASQTRRHAEELSQRGDHAGAARQYLEIANNSQGESRNRYLILAAREGYQSNDISGAERILAQVGQSVTDINLGLWATVSAEVKLAAEQPRQALNVLSRIPADDPDAGSARVLLLQAQALFQLGQAEAGVNTLMQRDAILRSAKDRSANQRLIYLGMQSAGENLPANPQSGNPIADGWLVLGYITWQQRSDVSGLRDALADWRSAYPEHPAATILVPELMAELGAMLNYPDRVAVLLPLGGRQKATAEVIRDGFLAAHFAQRSLPERPEIMIYDTSNGATEAYERALRDGADFVVGPLMKEAVAEITAYPDKVTTLTLNSFDTGGFGNNELYQFALSPESEARQVAQRAISEGRLNAIVLAPRNAWGERVINSFADELRNHGGKVLDTSLYDTQSPDFSENIKSLLLLDQGDARHQQINRIIGTNTGYEPRVREDADFIFLAANNKNGGMIRPQLRFHYAGQFATYSTSAIYQPGGKADSDLNGIIFPDSPWVIGTASADELDATIKTHWGKNAMRRQRFYAMGHDAYKLLPFLNSQGAQIPGAINGLSGTLSVDNDGRIERRLSWATISKGRPYPLAETPQLIQDNPESALLP